MNWFPSKLLWGKALALEILMIINGAIVSRALQWSYDINSPFLFVVFLVGALPFVFYMMALDLQTIDWVLDGDRQKYRFRVADYYWAQTKFILVFLVPISIVLAAATSSPQDPEGPGSAFKVITFAFLLHSHEKSAKKGRASKTKQGLMQRKKKAAPRTTPVKRQKAMHFVEFKDD